MGKYNKNKVAGKKAVVTYPSSFGSHKSMIDEGHAEFNEKSELFVVCKDDRGSYATHKSSLDSGLADYYRHGPNEFREKNLKKVLNGEEL